MELALEHLFVVSRSAIGGWRRLKGFISKWRPSFLIIPESKLTTCSSAFGFSYDGLGAPCRGGVSLRGVRVPPPLLAAGSYPACQKTGDG